MKYLTPYPLFESHGIDWSLPNFKEEWHEAKRYPEFREIGPKGWLALAKDGVTVAWGEVADTIGNIDLDFGSLDPDKRDRFNLAISQGRVEIPIAVKFSDGSIDLLGGNTRLAGLIGMGIEPPIWLITLKDGVNESEEELAGLRRMVDLGLIDYREMKSRLKELGIDDPTRAKFIELLKGVFAEAGVEWRDLATDRQSRNFTSVLNLTPAEVAKIIFSGRWVEGLSPRQVTRRDKLAAFLQTVRPQMERITGHEDPRMGFWFWIFQGSARPSGWVATPSSSDLFKFDGTITPEGALARFIYQLILDASYRRWE